MTTQKAFASYQEIIDLHTESDKVSVIGIHTPTSDTPRKMFGGFFDQFKKFKYLGCSISLVPAARLPADPLQVSAIYDEESPFQSIDPRDMLNPIMFHGCHGNDMGVILNRLYALNSLTAKRSDSIFQVEDMGELSGDTPVDEINGFQLDDLYYKALTDNTWKKAHPQRGFRKSGLRPLVYTMATNMQFLANGGLGSMGIPTQPEFEIGGTGGAETVIGNFGISQANRQFFTPRLTGLGWLDTRNVMTTTTFSDEVALENDFQNVFDMIDEGTKAQESLASLPLVYMGMILMPPAYKTEQYFRMIVNHHFAFKEFRGISFSNVITETPAYNDFNTEEESEGDDSGSGGNTGGQVPPGPDDPEPTGPALVDMYAQGINYTTNAVNSLTGVTYAKFLDDEDNEYTPTLTVEGTIRSVNFLVDSSASSGGTFPIGFYAVADGDGTGFKFSTNTGGVYDYADIVCTLGGLGTYYRVKNTTTWKGAINPNDAVFGITPANDSLPFGTSTDFQGVSLDDE